MSLVFAVVELLVFDKITDGMQDIKIWESLF
jgi:hypothetical protein